MKQRFESFTRSEDIFYLGVPQMTIRACFGNKCSQVWILPPRPNIQLISRRRSQTAKALVLGTSYCEFDSRRRYQFLCRSGGNGRDAQSFDAALWERDSCGCESRLRPPFWMLSAERWMDLLTIILHSEIPNPHSIGACSPMAEATVLRTVQRKFESFHAH